MKRIISMVMFLGLAAFACSSLEGDLNSPLPATALVQLAESSSDHWVFLESDGVDYFHVANITGTRPIRNTSIELFPGRQLLTVRYVPISGNLPARMVTIEVTIVPEEMYDIGVYFTGSQLKVELRSRSSRRA